MAFARVNGQVLHHRIAGTHGRPRLVFSNSLGSDFRIWDAVVDRLAGGFEILLYDSRGHGLSDAPSGDYSIADHSADLLALLDHLGWAKVSLVGLSVGGLIAQDIAIRHAGRLERLVLLDTAAKIGGPELWSGRIEAVGRAGLASISDAVIGRWFTEGFARERSAERQGWLNMLERTPAQGYAGTCAAIRDADFTAELGSIGVPTLVAVGDADLSTPPDLVRATAEAIPGARFEIIRDAGHLPCLETPDAVARLISDHVQGGAA
jgi:3-oxoadipate enol-lactonase